MRDPQEHAPPRLILLRGLPSAGKSTLARSLTRESGTWIEFDLYFHTEVGSDPDRYDWSNRLLPDARAWNIDRLRQAVDRREDPIVLDDDNGLGRTTGASVAYAVEHGYEVEFREPDTPWWRLVRQLLQNKDANAEALDRWAYKLAVLNRGTHRVSASSMRRRMDRWRDEITVEEILARQEARVRTSSSPTI